ncbi:SET domain-containing protein 9-like isoform X3 [Periplaneta americana]|uniref:SET domain-containing protein 9-like isoform X3 n=1 Tax=Periplaneta americana TaxID=6978 RepID=UPI0037E834C0
MGEFSEAGMITESVLGFCIMRSPSNVPGAGQGVVMKSGRADSGKLIALYPGTLYQPYEPILLPSIGNAFVFRCVDGIHVDGNDRRISRMIYKSCVSRDTMWPYQAGDLTWLTEHPLVPLNIGQYVNNQSPGFPANVAYQELDVPLACIRPELRCFLPNIWYSNSQYEHLRLIALVSTTNIEQGEEIFSNYYTVVH